MLSFWLVLTLLFAAANWLAVYFNWHKVELVAKPATLLCLIIWFSVTGGWQGALLWFGLGLVFSLAGDVFLMLPERFFIPGLVSFLVAHLFYLVGFNQSAPPINLISLVILVVVAFTAVLIYRTVRAGLVKQPKGARLQMPVLVYTIVISLMLCSAFLTFLRPDWVACSPAPALASLGALLFFISDGILAIIRFVRPLPHGRFFNMMTYHLGQILIAAAALIRFVN